jgi:lipoprotein-releasing system permease protein
MPTYSEDSLSLETLIPKSVATQLGVGVGDGIVCYFIQQPPRARKFKICGIYQTGVESEFGKPYLITDVRQLQKLNNWDSVTFSGVQVDVTKDSDPLLAARSISENLPPELTVHALETLYPQLFAWLGLFDTNELVILCIMLAVAGINMLGVMLVLILEKSQVIGVLKALGTSSYQLSRIFMGRASVEALKGIAIGLILGLGLCFAQMQFGLIQLDEASYYVKAVPIRLDYVKIVSLAVGEFLVCMAIAWVPLLTLRRLSPVKAMKYV